MRINVWYNGKKRYIINEKQFYWVLIIIILIIVIIIIIIIIITKTATSIHLMSNTVQKAPIKITK